MFLVAEQCRASQEMTKDLWMGIEPHRRWTCGGFSMTFHIPHMLSLSLSGSQAQITKYRQNFRLKPKWVAKKYPKMDSFSELCWIGETSQKLCIILYKVIPFVRVRHYIPPKWQTWIRLKSASGVAKEDWPPKWILHYITWVIKLIKNASSTARSTLISFNIHIYPIYPPYSTEVFGNFCTPGDKINGKYVQKIVARVLGIRRSRVQKGWALGTCGHYGLHPGIKWSKTHSSNIIRLVISISF